VSSSTSPAAGSASPRFPPSSPPAPSSSSGPTTAATSAASGPTPPGLGIFGNANFNGPNLQGPVGVDGLQYGITSAGDNPATGNTPVTGSNALTKDAVVFTLSGLPQNFDVSRIGNVWFQYGTALSEPQIPTPTPGAAAILGLGLAIQSRRRR
jgi:uncharacterized protein (TIGR03382 family)